ncbi:MAG: hypothetical protein H6662_02220 [Ardenticatenaceae bacterium]|nr:hypothetical protein [Anaerolineales bacterium]MCB8920376.1 hypothetical protein [Ardenticatenaceae bacterium]MCB8989331.1 hypothetical protein [Ardenticatenaceae bacterium]
MQSVLSNQTTRKRAAQSGAAGALWLVQAISGLLLVLLLLLHMVAHHFVVEGGLRNFQEVLAYVSNPAIFFLEIVFLIVVTAHAMLGARAILLDLGLSKSASRAANWGITLLGLAALVYGIWLAVAIQNL